MSLNITEIRTKNGLKTAVVNGYLIHSKYDPIKEAKQIVAKELELNYSYVLFGYGYGYLAKELFNQLEDKNHLFIYDPFLEDIYNSKDELDFNISKDLYEVKRFLESKMINYDRRVKMICSPNYNNIFNTAYKELLETIIGVQKENIVNENTVQMFSLQWQENYIMNLKPLTTNYSLSTLKNKYTLPVIVASAGPSLTKQLPLLKEIEQQVIIIAAGSTINSLLEANIEPDYVVSIDGSVNNYQHFQQLNTSHSKLIYALSSYYKIQENFSNEKYCFLYADESLLQEHIFKQIGIELPMINIGGTVATAAMHIATFISNAPVALIGQDLAYTNNQSHAENNKYYNEVDENFYKTRGAFESEGYYGDKVYTDYAFTSMRNAFESIYELLKNNHIIYNCTEGGLKIQNIPQKSFEKFCNEYVWFNGNKNVLLEEHAEKLNKVGELYVELEKQLTNYVELEEILEKSIKLVKLTKEKKIFSPNTIKKLDRNDDKIKSLFKEVVMERIVEPITITIMRDYGKKTRDETESETYERIYKQNIALYENLLEASKKSQQFTKNLMDNITSINGGKYRA